MKNFAYAVMLSLCFASVVSAAEKTQADYDKEVEENIKVMTQELQIMTDEMAKYMTALSKAMNNSMPQITKNMGTMVKSMEPVIENARKSAEMFQIEMENAAQIIQDADQNQDETVLRNNEINQELETLRNEQTPAPQRKIKLFSSSN